MPFFNSHHNITAQAFAVPVLVLLAAAALDVFFDERALVWVCTIAAVFLAGGYVVRVFRGHAASHIVAHRVTVTFFVWAFASAVFGVRSLQIVQLPSTIVLMVFVSVSGAYAWFQWYEKNMLLRATLAVLACEAGALLLYAGAPFFVLGALYAIWFWAIGSLSAESMSGSLTARRATGVIVGATLAALLFAISFPWVL